MIWTRCSTVVAMGVLLAVSLTTVGIVAGVSFTEEEVPQESEVGSTPTIVVTSEDPFEGKQSPWTIQASSELEGAEITIIAETVGNDVKEASGEEGLTLDAEEGIDTVTIRVQNGEVPEITSYNYENPEEEAITVLTISDADGPTIQEFTVQRYTEKSKQARQAIDTANEAVEAKGGEDAESRLDEAKVHYNHGEFEQAITAAKDAQEQAERNGSSDTENSTEGANTGSSDAEDSDDGSDGSGPGFGLGAAVTGLGGAGYLLKQRLDGTEDSE